MNPEDNKKCNKCLIYKSIDQFHKKRNDCKKCRANNDANNYKIIKETNHEKTIKERIPYRNELFKRYMQESNDLEYYNKFYIPFEKYEEMQKQPDKYSFCESDFVKKVDREAFKDDYDNKYFLDCIMMSDKKSAYVVHII